MRDVFHRCSPAQSRHLAARLVGRLPTCPIAEIARPGRGLRKWKDAFLPYFNTGGPTNAPHRSHQRNHGTGHTYRERLPQSQQLPTPQTPHHPRPRHLSPPPTYDELQAHATSFIFRHYLAAVLNRAHDNYKQQLPLITVRSTGNPGRETADTSGQPIM